MNGNSFTRISEPIIKRTCRFKSRICTCTNQIKPHLAFYQRTAAWEKASSDALSDSMKSKTRYNIASNVKYHSKVSENKRKSVVMNNENSDYSSGSSPVSAVSHKARDS